MNGKRACSAPRMSEPEASANNNFADASGSDKEGQSTLCPFGAVEYIVCSRQNNSRPAIGRSDATYTQCQEITPEESETAAAQPRDRKRYQRADQNRAGCRRR